MSAPPDYITQLLQGNNPYGTNGALYSPAMGIAAKLLEMGGPQRMPVSLGQALGASLQQGQQFQTAGLQNAMQQLMLGKTGAQLNWMMGTPNAAAQQTPVDTSMATTSSTNGLLTPQTPTPTSNAIDALASGKATPQQADQIANTPLPQPNAPQLGLTSPVQDGIIDPSQDPTYQYYVRGARLGIPEAATLAGQRKDIIMGSPQYAAAVESAKANVTPINVRQGGAVYIPNRGLVYQLPRLPEGATIDAQGNVSMAPGASNSIIQSQGSVGIGKLFGDPASYVDASGATRPTTEAANIFGTTNPFNLTNGGPSGGGRVTALPPSVSGGMNITGQETTKRANEAIEQQKPAQQTIAQLGQLQSNLEELGTGPGKETQLEVKKALASVGGFLGFPGLANANLTDAAAARKSIVNLTAPMVRAMGAREPFQMVSFIRDGMASISNPADANSVVIGMLRGIAEYQNDTGKFAGDWLNKNNGAGFVPGRGAWDANWQKTSDPGAYIFDNLPPFEQQAILNAAQKNPSLLAEVKRMATAKKMLLSQGYMSQVGEQ